MLGAIVSSPSKFNQKGVSSFRDKSGASDVRLKQSLSYHPPYVRSITGISSEPGGIGMGAGFVCADPGFKSCSVR